MAEQEQEMTPESSQPRNGSWDKKEETGDESEVPDEGEGQEVREMAMVALALLKQEVKVMLQQVKQLVKTNSQLAIQVFSTEVDGWTPVHACALRGKKKVLKAMLNSGLDVNLRMGQPEGLPAGCTLLHIAANRQDKKFADYLLSRGAEINAKDSFGRTPLFYAHRAGNKDVIKLLLDSGARLSPETKEVTLATTSGGSEAYCEELVTPEPKLSRFCFLPVSLNHHHQYQNAASKRHRRRLLEHTGQPSTL